MYQESDRVQLRHLLGFGSILMQADPRLENAITASQSIADGGTRPDSSTETFVKAQVTFAQQLETTLTQTWCTMTIGKADEASFDSFRGAIGLRSEGRRVVNSIARMLGLKGPRADIFAPATVNAHENPFEPDY